MGVRGMMMVTLETAAIVGVEKRLNPEQNIMGGAKYLAMLQERNIYGKTTADQLSISLAKYNLGPTNICLLYTSPSPRDLSTSRMPSSA